MRLSRCLWLTVAFSFLMNATVTAQLDRIEHRDALLRATRVFQALSEKNLPSDQSIGMQSFTAGGAGAISGKVVGPEHAPIPEAVVVAWSVGMHDPARNFALTDAEGNYVIGGLATGDYFVVAEAVGFLPEFYDNVRHMMEATAVHVEDPNTTPNVDFTLEPRVEGDGAISGLVTDGAGNPIVEARVFVFSVDNPFEHSRTFTESDGRYRVGGLPSGDYYVAVWAEGFLAEFYDDARTVEQAAPVTVVEPGETAGIDFVLSEGGSISGFVTTDSGEPIAEALVMAGTGRDAGNRHDFGEWGFAHTDETGHYTITGLAAGEYIVAASAGNFWTFVIEWYDDADTPEAATPVPVVEGQDTPGIDFALPLIVGSGSISGRVTDAQASPLPEVLILAHSRNDQPTGVFGTRAHAMTDAEGNYRIDELPAGDYIVSAHYWNGHVYIVKWYDNVDSREQATPVPVSDNQEVTGIDFTIPTMRGTGAISGMVESEQGQPLSKVLVQAWLTERDGTWWGSIGHARTNELGEYVIDELPAGTYLVSADFFGDRVHVREWYDNAQSADEATSVPVEDNQETVDINFSLDIDGNLGAIAGSLVSDSDGSPVPHAFVEAHGAQTNVTGHFRGHGFAFTDKDGNYVIVDLPEGPYYVSVFADGIHEFYDDAQSIDEATPVQVFEDDTTVGIDFGISVPDAIGGLISGLVFDDSTGLPVVSAVVVAVPNWVLSNVTPIRHFHHQFFRFTTTDEFGNYAIRGLEDGGYYLFCFAEGYIGEFYDDVRDPTEASLVEIQGGQERSGIDFGLKPWQRFGIGLSAGNGSLEGIVVDIDSLSIEGAYIYVLDADGNAVGFARTAADGGYSISGLQEGSYHLQASRIGFQTEFFGDAATLEGSIPITLGTNSGLSVESVDFALESSTVTGVKRLQDAEIPTSLRLYQNFPNPFNPATEIQYDLPEDADVNLTVYNLVGEEVVTLHYGPQTAGSYKVIWNGKNVSGREVPSGIYFYRLSVAPLVPRNLGQAGTHSLVRKAMLLR